MTAASIEGKGATPAPAEARAVGDVRDPGTGQEALHLRSLLEDTR